MKTKRYVAFYVLMIVTFIIISARLVNLQISNGSQYREKSDSRPTHTIELLAARGEILDRNGRPIVSNRTGYSIYILNNGKRTPEELNALITRLFDVMEESSGISEDVLPIAVEDGKYVFDVDGDTANVWKKKNDFDEKDSAEDIINALAKNYKISREYTKEEKLVIASVRFDMTVKGFSSLSPYLFKEDATIEEISVIKEQGAEFSDVSVITQPIRTYLYPTLGAHMLGRVGMINADEYEANKSAGYSINSYIGKSGIEKHFEEYLRGQNGTGSTVQNADGYSMGQSIDKQPVSGRNVTLTIDLDMQLACEKALKDTINEINQNATSADDGRDADAGSIVVIDVNTGDILAMASYPTYDIETFTECYNDLLEARGTPLFNRALAGTYSPASTFKLLVGTAALEEGIITPEEEILDTGKYTYFEDYQPGCWIYNQSGATHGYLNVSEAIMDSCNVFFFDVGRRLGIDKINEYAKKFGFGQKSGIELGEEEKNGVVASPENREKNNQLWYPGDVCQTAIGQSDTLVTPLQLANYIATIANGGTRYRPHIVKTIQNTDGTPGEDIVPEIIEKINMSESTRNAITEGMRKVVTEGTARSAFEGCTVQVAAKTGSAQTSGSYTNGVCVAYAPYDKPQIAVACVIEKAGSGARTSAVVRAVIDSYFDNSEENNMSKNVLTK